MTNSRKNTKIAQDIYNIKQTPSHAILAATLFLNSTGHLLHKTNPDLSYFELSYHFEEHKDSVGQETTALHCTMCMSMDFRLSILRIALIYTAQRRTYLR